jgi:Lar family restriction alleviation protein
MSRAGELSRKFGIEPQDEIGDVLIRPKKPPPPIAPPRIDPKKLNPCPFCGGEASPLCYKSGCNVYFVKCGRCGARTPIDKDKGKVMAIWNRRAESGEKP